MGKPRHRSPSGGILRTRFEKLNWLYGAIGSTPVGPPLEPYRQRRRATKLRRLAEIGTVCECCQRQMPAPRLVHLHHIVFVSRGGPDTDDNVVLLCPTCHAMAHWIDRDLLRFQRPQQRAELIALINAAVTPKGLTKL